MEQRRLHTGRQLTFESVLVALFTIAMTSCSPGSDLAHEEEGKGRVPVASFDPRPEFACLRLSKTGVERVMGLQLERLLALLVQCGPFARI